MNHIQGLSTEMFRVPNKFSECERKFCTFSHFSICATFNNLVYFLTYLSKMAFKEEKMYLLLVQSYENGSHQM